MSITSFAFIGRPRAGKDTCAAFLTQRGYQLVRFALPVYRICETIIRTNGITRHTAGIEFSGRVLPKNRELLRIVAESMKPIYGDNMWAELARQSIVSKFVVSDLRFNAELQMLESLPEYRVITIRVLRDGIVDDHATETELDDLPTHYTVCNNGSITDLEAQLADILAQCDTNG